MKRKRSSTQSQPHSNTFSITKRVTRSTTPSLKKCSLLQLPPEVRARILQHLLYSAEPLGRKSGVPVSMNRSITYRFNEKSFTLYPAILRVCRQIYEEGKDILYRQNTAKATLSWRNERLLFPPSSMSCLHNILPLGSHDFELTRRFTKWDVTVEVYLDCPRTVRFMVANFIFGILCTIPNLHELKVRLLWYGMGNQIQIGNHQDFDDVAEQLFRPFSKLRVRKVDFVDKDGRPIRTMESLSRLMMSDTPPHDLHGLLNNLYFFIDHSIAAPSRPMVKSHTFLLTAARNEYDVEAFRFALRQFLAYLRHFRGLEPPEHILEFAQDSVSAATNMGRIIDCPKDVLVYP